jgi:hypothetical protein
LRFHAYMFSIAPLFSYTHMSTFSRYARFPSRTLNNPNQTQVRGSKHEVDTLQTRVVGAEDAVRALGTNNRLDQMQRIH